MGFQWDPTKAQANRRKHGVGFPNAVGVFEDPVALTRADPHASEDRQVTIGVDFVGRVLVVAWTWRGEHIRVISARLATPSERRQYQEG
jgi:hypothetical protein